jgi:hypothetical protein
LGWVELGGGVIQNPLYAPFRGLCLDSGYAYAAHSEYGLDIWQIGYLSGENLDTSFCANLETSGDAYDAAITHDHHLVAVADYQQGLLLVDVTDPRAPTVAGRLLPPTANAVFKVFIRDYTAYFLDENTGLFAADIRDPANPRLTAFFDTPDPSGLFVTENNTIFVTDEDYGLYILRWK